MRCPRCVQEIGVDSAQCPHCGFGLAALDEVFGQDAVILNRLTDAARCLKLRDREAIEEELDRFEDTFPQLFAAVYLGFLPRMTSIRQFGFWLMNRAAVTAVDYTKPNDHGILLVIDMSSQSASLTLGYRVEPFIRDRDLMKILKSGHSGLVAGDYGGGVRKSLKQLTRVLRMRALWAGRGMEKMAARYRQPVEEGEIGLKPIREHHRTGGDVRSGQPDQVKEEEWDVG